MIDPLAEPANALNGSGRSCARGLVLDCDPLQDIAELK